MTGGSDRNTKSDPVDGVYEIDLEDESPDQVLREVEEAVAAGGRAAADEPPQDGRDDFLAMREKYLRALADFDNYRKRVERERAETSRGAQAETLRAFLSVVDNLDRALGAGGSGNDLRAGVQMILKQSEDVLRRFGVEPVPALGQPFDPALHEAVVRFEDPEVDVPMVSEEFQRGYRYHGRLLRPAMVKVAVPVEGHGGGPGSGDDDGGTPESS
jgi:molecular chaperone GrpE